MGTQVISSHLILQQVTKNGQWTMKNQLGTVFLINNFSGNQFQLKNKRISSQQLKKYIFRQKYSYNHTPKLFTLDHSSPNVSILVQYAPHKISEIIQLRKLSPIQILNEILQLISTLSYLVNKYGCFYISEAMIRFNNNDYQPILWLNQDFSKNEPQFPLPNGQGQQTMIDKICKTYEKICLKKFKIDAKNTFKKTLVSIQQQLNKLRNQSYFQTPTRSNTSRMQIVSSNNCQNEKINHFYSKSFETNSQFNDTLLLKSEPISNNILECSRNTTQINRIQQQSNLKQKNYQHFLKQHSLETNQTYNYGNRKQKSDFLHFCPRNTNSSYKARRFTAVAPHPKVPAITFKNSESESQRVSSDSQYKRIFLNKSNANTNLQPTTISPPTINIRNTNQSSATSYQSLNLSGFPVITLKSCGHTQEQIRCIVTPQIYDNKQLQKNKPIENSQKLMPSSSQKKIETSEMSPEDFNISQSHINEDQQYDFDGCFESNKQIKEQSQIGSPLKRQLKNDLRQLFF